MWGAITVQNRSVSTPARLQRDSQVRARSAQPGFKAVTINHIGSRRELLSVSFTLRGQGLGHGAREEVIHNGNRGMSIDPNKNNSTTPNQKTMHSASKELEHSGHGLQRFCSIDPLDHDQDSENKIGDFLDLLPDWIKDEDIFQTPESPPVLSPTPVHLYQQKAFSQFRDRNGIWHNVKAVVIADGVEDDVVTDMSEGPYSQPSNPKVPRIRPTPLPIGDLEDDYWTGTTVLRSIERDDDSHFVNDTDNLVQASSSADFAQWHNSEDYNDHEEFQVESILGQRIGPGIHEYLIKWVGYEDLSWTQAQNCNCPDAINRFQSAKEAAVQATALAIRGGELQRMHIIGDAAGLVAEYALLHRHPGWRCCIRNRHSGRFEALGRSNSVLEIVRLPAAQADHQANGTRLHAIEQAEESHWGPMNARWQQRMDDMERAEIRRRRLEDSQGRHREMVEIEAEAQKIYDDDDRRKQEGKQAREQERQSKERERLETSMQVIAPSRRIRHSATANRKDKRDVAWQSRIRSQKRKLQQTLAKASEYAAKLEYRPNLGSAFTRSRMARSFSSMRRSENVEKLRGALDQEARIKAAAMATLVRSEFRKSLSKKRAKALIDWSKIYG